MSRPVSRLRRFLWQLFTSNEEYRLTDDKLKAIIRKQFPQSKLDVAVGRHKDRLAIWRSEYNRNRMSEPRQCVSVAYLEKEVHVSNQPGEKRKGSDRGRRRSGSAGNKIQSGKARLPVSKNKTNNQGGTS